MMMACGDMASGRANDDAVVDDDDDDDSSGDVALGSKCGGRCGCGMAEADEVEEDVLR